MMNSTSLMCSLRAVVILLFLSCFTTVKAYTIKNLTAEYHSGQVFLTWTTPNHSNLQYNIYRSTISLTSATQLSTAAYLGFVRDSSSKDFLWTKELGDPVFYKITDSGAPLASNQGVYAVTCTDNLPHYYAVTVTDLSTGVENKTMVIGENTLSLSVIELVKEPQPVWQDSITTANDEVKQRYVLWGNNQETSLYPAMTSVGSWGFDFFLVKRGNPSKFSLYVLYEAYGHDADKSVNLDLGFGDCYVMGVFDWLPIPAPDDKGDNTFYSGCHENFNFYSDQNLVPTSGNISMYTQRMVMEQIQWVKEEFPIDANKVYLKGTSANGYGALLTAVMYSEQIAAVYCVVEPNGLSASTDEYKQMWGVASSGLKSDIIRWNGTDTLKFKDLTDIHKMLSTNKQRSMPPIYDVHGKNDESVIWDETKIKWLDSLENNLIGGARYWDQRDHSCNGRNFDNAETEPDYTRYALNKSYPVFSKCTIDQDPGNGSRTNGDAYGTINGYLDFQDSIVDKVCKYNLTVFIKDLYVGGTLDPQQYNTCKTNITFRRMQKFQPAVGDIIQWKNFDDNNLKIQHGSFTYNGGLITLKNIIVNKSGNLIKLKIQDCTTSRLEDDDDWDVDENQNPVIYFEKSPDGYIATIESSFDESVDILVYDLMGRKVCESKTKISAGSNRVEIRNPGNGIYLVQLRGESFTHAVKLFF